MAATLASGKPAFADEPAPAQPPSGQPSSEGNTPTTASTPTTTTVDPAVNTTTTAPGSSHRSGVSVVVPALLGAVGLTGIGLGIGFAISSQHLTDDYREIRSSNQGLCAVASNPKCVQYDAKRSDADTASTTSIVSYVAGGVLLAGAIATFIFWPTSSDSNASSSAAGKTKRVITIKPMPIVGADMAGGAVTGTFF